MYGMRQMHLEFCGHAKLTFSHYLASVVPGMAIVYICPGIETNACVT